MRLIVIAALIAAGCTVVPGAASQAGDEVTDRIDRTLPLAAGSDVRIRGINGLVEVETFEGGGAAEVHVSIRASSREAMERRPLLVESTADSLTIHTRETDRGPSGREWVRHEVQVRLPRGVNLDVSSVNGQVDVGAIDGRVGLTSINGRTTIAHAGSASEISSINGRTTIAIARLGDGGLRVHSINGGIDIALPAGLSADLDVSGVNGGVDSDLPITVTGRVRRGQMRGTLGNGGPPLVITAVNGGVRLTRQ